MKSIEDIYDNEIEENDYIGDIKVLELADLATLFANDMKHIHLHAIGEHFDTIHGLSQDYYEALLEQADYFYEKAIAQCEGAGNPTGALSRVGEELWMPESSDAYTLEEFNAFLLEKGALYLDFLEGFDKESYPDAIGNVVDEFADFWDSEISYKAEARNITGAEIIPEGDETGEVTGEVTGEEDALFGDVSDEYLDPARWGFTQHPDDASPLAPVRTEEPYSYANGVGYEEDTGVAPFGATANGDDDDDLGEGQEGEVPEDDEFV